jgi:glutamine cyclotransferase
LPKSLFAEGLTLFNEQFYLLTWRSQRLLVFDRNWTQIAEYPFLGQGWGLTHNGVQLIASDGSDQLKFYNPDGYRLEKTLRVTGHGRSWDRLNELEYVDGIIWANRWLSDEVIAIDGQTGEVLGVMDLTALSKPWRNVHEKVLNGLAWSPDHQAMWVTGKLWPVRYLIQVDLAGVLADRPR